jgi:hypothetical protein
VSRSRSTPAERSLQAKVAVETSWANTADPVARTAPARKAALERFEREVDPDGVLEPGERARRAEHARKAYFARLALKSAQARRRKRDERRRLPSRRHVPVHGSQTEAAW